MADIDAFTTVSELRRRGHAVSIFVAEDVPESVGDLEARAEWLLNNRKYIEDAMVTTGNQVIEQLAPVGSDEDDPDYDDQGNLKPGVDNV